MSVCWLLTLYYFSQQIISFGHLLLRQGVYTCTVEVQMLHVYMYAVIYVRIHRIDSRKFMQD